MNFLASSCARGSTPHTVRYRITVSRSLACFHGLRQFARRLFAFSASPERAEYQWPQNAYSLFLRISNSFRRIVRIGFSDRLSGSDGSNPCHTLANSAQNNPVRFRRLPLVLPRHRIADVSQSPETYRFRQRRWPRVFGWCTLGKRRDPVHAICFSNLVRTTGARSPKPVFLPSFADDPRPRPKIYPFATARHTGRRPWVSYAGGQTAVTATGPGWHVVQVAVDVFRAFRLTLIDRRQYPRRSRRQPPLPPPVHGLRF